MEDDDDSMQAFEAALSFLDEYAADFVEQPSQDAHPEPVTASPLLLSHGAGEGIAGVGTAENLPLLLPLDAFASPIAAAGDRDTPDVIEDTAGKAVSLEWAGHAAAELKDTAAAVACPNSKSQAPTSVLSPEERQKQQRAERNARRKLLRKVGVYADPNRARNQRNREVAYLHKKVGQLQGKLRKLVHLPNGGERQPFLLKNVTSVVADTDARDEEPRTDSHELAILQRAGLRLQDSSGGAAKALGVWQGVAMRQCERREQAERENVRLKLVLESQIKVAKGLQGLLDGSAKQQMSECSSALTTNCTKFARDYTTDYLTDTEGFNDLLARVEAAYHDIHMLQAVDHMSVKIFSSKVLPFGVRTAGKVMWNHFEGPEKHRGNGSMYEKAVKHLNTPFTIVEDFCKALFTQRTRADACIKQIVRRFVEEDREIVIRLQGTTPVEIGYKLLSELTFHRCGYALVKRAAASTPENEMSLLQLVTVLSVDKEHTSGEPVSVRALTDFLLEVSACNMRSYQDAIENVLMDQALKSSGQTVSV